MPASEEDIAWLKSTFHRIPRPALPEDCIEYSIFVLSEGFGASNDSETRLRLREVQDRSAALQKQWLKDYIWQRRGFGLELHKDDGEVGTTIARAIVNGLTVHTGVSYLGGRTEYGDSIEDEWVIVWLLRELSKTFDDIWIKVTDSDGEFLLIEASGALPAWLEPDVAENRVWINQGQLKIIKPGGKTQSMKRTSEQLSLTRARQTIVSDKKRLMHSSAMEEEAFYRLRNYPAQIRDNMHHALITLPRKVAFLLKSKARYISPAIEAFYLRDPVALKPMNAQGYQDKTVMATKDMVTISVRFPKVAYAQLKSQDLPLPTVFEELLPVKGDERAYAMAQIGMRITCGFEILLTDRHYQDLPAVREMKLLLDDLETGDEVLPSDSEIEKWDKRADEEGWLDIDFDDLERELDGKTGKSGTKKREFGDKTAQENLQRIVKQFEEFLNDDKAGPDGAGLFGEDSDDETDDDESEDEEGEDKVASFDEDEFSKMMQEMMGMPPEVMKEIMNGKLGPDASQTRSKDTLRTPQEAGRVVDLDEEPIEKDEEMEKIMEDMETELRGKGALNLDPVLKKTSAMKKAIKADGRDSDLSEDDLDDNEIDANLVKNLLESFKAQGGVAGPGGNMMGLMGVNIPRDEGDSDEEAAGPSRPKFKKRS